MTTVDILSIIVIIVDLIAATFLIWRVTSKTATLDWKARIIYWWVITTQLYHAVIYTISMFNYDANAIIITYLHPLVVLFMLSAPLIAIIHWRGGHL